MNLHINKTTMESSVVSYPNNSGLSSEPTRSFSIDHEEEAEQKDEEVSPEESGWTEYLEDFSDYVRRLEGGGEEEEEETSHGDEYSNHSMIRSASMVSDAGSGPEWKIRNYNNHIINIPKRLNMKRAKEMPYDDSLEDTASSPVNSPKITMGLKRMDINCRRADETLDTYHGKGRAVGNLHDEDEEMEAATNMKMNGSTRVVDQQGQVLGEKGLCLVPVTILMNFNYQCLPRF